MSETRNIVPRNDGEGSIGTEEKRWGKGYFDELVFRNRGLIEATGYGIITGCEATIEGFLVTVSKGIVHLANGERKETDSVTVTIAEADSTSPRIDLIYFDETGNVQKINGTLGVTTEFPTLPSNCIQICTVTVSENATKGVISSTTALRDAHIKKGRAFLYNSYDELLFYPIAYASPKDLDTTDTDIASRTLYNQSLCGQKDENGVIQNLYMCNTSTDNTLAELVQFQRKEAEAGYITWEAKQNTYVKNVVGHGDCAVFKDDLIYINNHAFSAETLENIGLTPTWSHSENASRGWSYDPVTKNIVRVSTPTTMRYKGAIGQINIYDKDFNFLYSVSLHSSDTDAYIIQDICAYDGIIYVTACFFAYGTYMINTALGGTSQAVFCYDYEGNFLKRLILRAPTELEGIEVDATGYMYISCGGTRMNGIYEAPLLKNKFSSLRSSLISSPSVVDANITVYVDSPIDAKNFGTGLGIQEVPFTSYTALCYSLPFLSDISNGRITVMFMNEHSPNKYDCDLYLHNIHTSILLYNPTYINSLGNLTLASEKTLDDVENFRLINYLSIYDVKGVVIAGCYIDKIYGESVTYLSILNSIIGNKDESHRTFTLKFCMLYFGSCHLYNLDVILTNVYIECTIAITNIKMTNITNRDIKAIGKNIFENTTVATETLSE